MAWGGMGRGGFVFHSGYLGPTFSPWLVAAHSVLPQLHLLLLLQRWSLNFLMFLWCDWLCFLSPGLDWKGRRGGKPNEPFRLFEMLRWEQEEQSSPTTELNRRKIHQNFLYCLFLLLNLRTWSRGLGDNGGN